MADPARRRATYDDLVALPENVVGEILDGELVVSPRPSAAHANAASALIIDLGSPFQRGRGGPGGWLLLVEPELHFGQDVLVPDLAGWRRERMPSVPATAAIEVAPDWICEVSSPSTARADRVLKLPIYARVGVSFAWILDPGARTLEVFALRDGGWQLLSAHGDDEIVRAPPFDAVELDLLPLWGETRPGAP